MNKKNIFACTAFVLVVVCVVVVLYLRGGEQDTPHEEPTQDTPADEIVDNDFDQGIFDNDSSNNSSQELVIVFHNNAGPMCLDAIEFFQQNDIDYEEHLTSDEDFVELLSESQARYNGESEGVSGTFGYYPIIFVGSKAFSGFDDTVRDEIRLELDI